MKMFADTYSITRSICFFLLLFVQHPLISVASCFCRFPNQQNDTTPLSQRLVPLNYRMTTYAPLTNVQHVLNYENLTEIYVDVLENFQFLTFLKQQIGMRIGEDVPSPDRHCFISERSQLASTETNPGRFSSRLVDDLCMMVNLVNALDRAVLYERENCSNQFTFCLAIVKYGVEVIVEGLTNITNVSINHCATSRSSQDGGESDPNGGGSDEGNGDGDVTYSSRQHNIIPGNNAQLAEEPTSNSFEGQEITRSAREAGTRHVIGIQLPVSEATPTARPRRSSSNTNCGAISSDSQQFVYIYEVWVGLWYLYNDLLPMRDHFATY